MMTNKLTKTINVIFFGSDYLIKSNDERITIDQVIKNKNSVLFLHESFKTKKNQQNKIIQLCKDSPLIFHYFPQWFNQKSIQEKLTSDYTFFFFAMFFPDISVWNKSGRFKNIYISLFFQSTKLPQAQILNWNGISFHSHFFKPINLLVHEVLLLKQTFNQMQLIDHIVLNWIQNRKLARFVPKVNRLTNPFHIICCNTKLQAIECKSELIKQKISGMVVCFEQIAFVKENNVSIIHSPANIRSIFHILKKISKNITEVAVFFYWNSDCIKRLNDKCKAEVVLFETNEKQFNLYNGLLLAFKQKVNAPKEIFELPNLYLFRLNVNDLNLNDEQSFLLQLMKTPKKRINIYNSQLSIENLKMAISICYNVSKKGYFQNSIFKLIFNEVEESFIFQVAGLETFKNKEISENNTEDYIKGLLREFSFNSWLEYF